MEWTLFNWINVFFLFLNGYLAYQFFNEDNKFPAYLNLVASAVNAACIAAIIM